MLIFYLFFNLFTYFFIDTCGWYNDLNANFPWARSKPSSSFGSVTPPLDHTSLTKNGYFMLIRNNFFFQKIN